MKNAQQIMWQLASAWRDAGAKPLDVIETLLEMLASRCHGSKLLDDNDELTLRGWERQRIELADELELPPASGSLERCVNTVPGLLEQTRRTVAHLLADTSNSGFKDMVSGLLNILVSAPQLSGGRSLAPAHFTSAGYLSDLLIRLLGKPSAEPVYCPYESSSWMPLSLAKAGWPVDCELSDPQVARVLLLFASINNWKIRVRVSDPIRRPSWVHGSALHKFKYTVAITSFGLRLRDETYRDLYHRFPVRFYQGEAAQIAHLIAQTSGRLLVIVPESFLFRTSGGEREYKEKLIRGGLLSTVVRLPRGTFAPNTSVQSSLLIFETHGPRNRDVLFLDAADDLGRRHSREKERAAFPEIEQIVSIVRDRCETSAAAIRTSDEIAEQEFNISVDRYVHSEEKQKIAIALDEEKTVELKDIAEVIRAQAVAGEGGSEGTRAFFEVSLQDVQPDGSIRQPGKIIRIEDLNLSKAVRQKLEPGDVLLSIRGRIGTVGLVSEMRSNCDPANWIASQAFVILRLRSNSPIKPVTLYRYLSSPLGKGLLQSLAAGATVPMVSMGDIKKIKIMIPSATEQREIERQYDKILKLRSQISQLERMVEELNSEVWPMTKVIVSN